MDKLKELKSNQESKASPEQVLKFQELNNLLVLRRI